MNRLKAIAGASLLALAMMLTTCSPAPPTSPGGVPPWVPGDVVPRVDQAELAPLSPAIEDERRALETRTGAYVAAYLSGAQPRRAGSVELCSLFEAADLDASSLAAVRIAERRHPGVLFVAYARPLVRLPRRGP